MSQASPLTPHSHPVIHPTAVVGDDVQIGHGTEIGPYAVLMGPLRIGSGCTIGAHCVIGGDPEHRARSKSGQIVIGDNNVFREGCVVHHGTGQRDTAIGNRCYIMNRVYIAHDCIIGDGVTLAGGVSLGGHATVQVGANIGLNASVHQFSTIGAYAMIGMGTPVAKDVPPFCLVAGNPMQLRRLNTHPLAQLGIANEEVVLEGLGLWYSLSNAMIAGLVDQFIEQSRRAKLFEVQFASPISRKPR
jgi:UDP-N-acetylglucosamine acyltransferase